MGGYSTAVTGLTDISHAVLTVLSSAFPDVVWAEEIKGAGIPTVPTGTISADEIRYERRSKISDVATVSFSIYLIVPDPEDRRAEELALSVKAVLTQHSDLNGAALDSRVRRILFGTAPGVHGAGAALLVYDVDVMM